MKAISFGNVLSWFEANVKLVKDGKSHKELGNVVMTFADKSNEWSEYHRTRNGKLVSLENFNFDLKIEHWYIFTLVY